MILSNHYVRQQLGFADLRGFDALPAASEVVRNIWALEAASDGLGQIPDFGAKYTAAQAASQTVDSLPRDVPEFTATIDFERGLNATLQAQIKDVAFNYEWDVWDPLHIIRIARSTSRQAALQGNIVQVGKVLTDYAKIPGMIATATAAYDKRQAAKQAAIQADLEETAEQARLLTAKASAQVADQVFIRSKATAAAAVEERAATATQFDIVNIQKQIAKAQEMKILGLPVSTVIPLGLGGAALLFFLTRRKAAAPKLQGYRRRRR